VVHDAVERADAPRLRRERGLLAAVVDQDVPVAPASAGEFQTRSSPAAKQRIGPATRSIGKKARSTVDRSRAAAS